MLLQIILKLLPKSIELSLSWDLRLSSDFSTLRVEVEHSHSWVLVNLFSSFLSFDFELSLNFSTVTLSLIITLLPDLILMIRFEVQWLLYLVSRHPISLGQEVLKELAPQVFVPKDFLALLASLLFNFLDLVFLWLSHASSCWTGKFSSINDSWMEYDPPKSLTRSWLSLITSSKFFSLLPRRLSMSYRFESCNEISSRGSVTSSLKSLNMILGKCQKRLLLIKNLHNVVPIPFFDGKRSLLDRHFLFLSPSLHEIMGELFYSCMLVFKLSKFLYVNFISLRTQILTMKKRLILN